MLASSRRSLRPALLRRQLGFLRPGGQRFASGGPSDIFEFLRRQCPTPAAAERNRLFKQNRGEASDDASADAACSAALGSGAGWRRGVERPWATSSGAGDAAPGLSAAGAAAARAKRAADTAAAASGAAGVIAADDIASWWATQYAAMDEFNAAAAAPGDAALAGDGSKAAGDDGGSGGPPAPEIDGHEQPASLKGAAATEGTFGRAAQSGNYSSAEAGVFLSAGEAVIGSLHSSKKNNFSALEGVHHPEMLSRQSFASPPDEWTSQFSETATSAGGAAAALDNPSATAMMQALTEEDADSPPIYELPFKDFAEFTVRAGDGGRHRVGVCRPRRASRGPAFGGDGADVVLACDRRVDSLLRLGADIEGLPGGDATDTSRGRTPRAVVVPVPLGTIVRVRVKRPFGAGPGASPGAAPGTRAASAGDDGRRRWLARSFDGRNVAVGAAASIAGGVGAAGDLAACHFAGRSRVSRSDIRFVYWHQFLQHEDQLLVARGGRGSIGEAFRGSKDRVPPTRGEVRRLQLELRLACDVFLLGEANAGKTSVLSAVTRAFGNIGADPGTTARPLLGSVKYRDGLAISLCDAPPPSFGDAVIAGASQHRNRNILRHAYRAKVIAYVVSAAGAAGPRRQPPDLFQQVLRLRDLARNSHPAVRAKRELIIVTKCDMLHCDTLFNLDALAHRLAATAEDDGLAHVPVVGTSARFGLGLERLVAVLRQTVYPDLPDVARRRYLDQVRHYPMNLVAPTADDIKQILADVDPTWLPPVALPSSSDIELALRSPPLLRTHSSFKHSRRPALQPHRPSAYQTNNPAPLIQ